MSATRNIDPGGADASEIARRFVDARLGDTPLSHYPGREPASLGAAYACQDAAIAMWPDVVAGWKIGRIGADLVDRYGADRLAGPIFRRSVTRADAAKATPFEIYTGGFAAIEAEFILVLGEDAAGDRMEWTREDARALVAQVHVGVELAGSPFEGINDFGPAVTVSDFGNNAGLILGEPLADWRARPESEWTARAFINGVEVGQGAAAALPGGPFESLRFLLELNACRGRPLRAGDLISSGAVTGVHRVAPGDAARFEFAGARAIECEARLRSRKTARAADR